MGSFVSAQSSELTHICGLTLCIVPFEFYTILLEVFLLTYISPLEKLILYFPAVISEKKK